MKNILTIIATLLALQCGAQEIAGRIINRQKQPVAGARVIISQGGITKGICITDKDGNYQVKPLDPGYYDEMIAASALDTFLETGIVVSAHLRTTVNCTMHPLKNHRLGYNTDDANQPVIIGLTQEEINAALTDMTEGMPNDCGRYMNPPKLIGRRRDTLLPAPTVYIIDEEIDPVPAYHPRPLPPAGDYTLTREQINQMPYTDINDIVSTLPGIYQARRGDAISIEGGRLSGTAYIVDGVHR